ncbi:unnamed protein product [Adineta steineri]|uniref:Uncharacterized protein n=3 Tax=Adineta steineri TaxID=433720 RepID=A0A815J2D5_9BILA|nr:unnamed protein product [Adineta steineri]
MNLTEDEHNLLKLGPRFIYNHLKAASRRRNIGLNLLKREIQTRFLQQKAAPGLTVDQFINELGIRLQNLHGNPIRNRISEFTRFNNKKKNYYRLLQRLKYKFHLLNIILQKTDKSKVFHLGKMQDYQLKSKQYMDKTGASKCLGTNDPLSDLVERTNKYLVNMRLLHRINQKQYEKLCVKPDEVELAHLYYLPKAHKPGTPLKPIAAVYLRNKESVKLHFPLLFMTGLVYLILMIIFVY